MDNEFKVEPVDYQDVPGIASAMMAAMYMDEHFRMLFNNISLQEIIDDTMKRMPLNLSTHRECKRHEKVIHTKTGMIVGYARWVLPQSIAGDTTWREAQTRQPTEEEKEIFQHDFNSTLDNGRRRIENHEITRGVLGNEKGNCFDEVAKDKDWIELECLVTAPAYQRKGIASLLLKSGMEQVQKLQVNVIVMSTGAGLPFYHERGFHLVRTISQDFSDWGITNPRVTGFLVKEIYTPLQDGGNEELAQH